MIKIKKGLNIPINGEPTEDINVSKNSRSVAILGDDYVGMKPTMFFKEGDHVNCGEKIFEDKKNKGIFPPPPCPAPPQSSSSCGASSSSLVEANSPSSSSKSST